MASFSKRRYTVAIAICLMLQAASLYAQERYTLAQLVDSSKRYLPLLKQKRAQVQAAQANLSDVKSTLLPQVKFSEQLNIGTDNSLSGSFFTFGITPSTSAGVRAANTMEAATGNVGVLYGEYELANFGLNGAKIDYAKANIDLQQADAQKEEYINALNVAKLYFTLLKYEYQASADRQNTERYSSIFNVIQALTKSGINPGADSSLAKAEMSKARISYNQTIGKITQVKQQLAYLTGVAINKLSADTLRNMQWENLPVVASDTAQNPVISYYAKRKDALQYNEQLIKKSYLPKVMLASGIWARGSSIQYNDQYKALSEGLGYQRFNYAVGLAFTYNLFNGLYRKNKLAVNRFQMQASNYDLQQQQLLLQTVASQADSRIQVITDNLKELPVQLTSARAVFNQKTAQYKAGIISLIDLTNASFVLYRSQTDYIEAISDWYLAGLDKAAANGSLLSFIQTINR